jgi:hypothetical protein
MKQVIALKDASEIFAFKDRDQFETDEENSKKILDHLSKFQKQNIYIKSGMTLRGVLITEKRSYDVKKQELTIPIGDIERKPSNIVGKKDYFKGAPKNIIGLQVCTEIKNQRQYMSTNGFGAQVEVTELDKLRYFLIIDNGFEQGIVKEFRYGFDDDMYALVLGMSPTEAREKGQYLRSALEIEIIPKLTTNSENRDTPTFKNPLAIKQFNYNIFANIKSILVYDNRDMSIWSNYIVNSFPGKKYVLTPKRL